MKKIAGFHSIADANRQSSVFNVNVGLTYLLVYSPLVFKK